MGHEIFKLDAQTWRIEDQGVRIFLLTGTQKALLIDSGMNLPKAKQLAESLTSLPLQLLNTHADMDHISGNEEFTSFYMHPDEEENYRASKKNGTLLPVKGGDVLNLGDRPLKILDLPGHTPGSIAVLDINNRVLYSGDAIQDGNIFMFGPFRNMEKYIGSLEKLDTDAFDAIYPSHGSLSVSPSIVPKLIAGAKKIVNGEITGNELALYGQKIVRYNVDCAAFLCGK